MKKISKIRIFGFLYGFSRPHMPLLIIGMLLYVSQAVLFPLMSSVLTGGITGAILNLSYTDLLAAGIRTLAILVCTIILLWLGILMYVAGELKTKRRLQIKMIRAFINADVENRIHTGERLSMLNNDAELANAVYGDALANLLFCLMPVIGLSITVFAIEWRMGLYTLFAGLFALAGQLLFAKPLAKIAHGKLEKISAASKTLGDIFSGGVIARVFSLQDRLLNIFGRDNDDIRRLVNREARINGEQALFMGITGLLTTGGVFIVGSMLIPGGDLTLPALMAIFPISSSAALSMANIGNAWAGMQAPFEAGRRVYEMLDGDNSLGTLAEQKKPSITEGYSIDVRNLTFSFKDADKTLFRDVNLTIEENRFAAFIGESGGGKSTLLKIISGLYDRDGFEIAIGEKPCSMAYAEEWRSYFAYIDQNCTLFNMTVGENIALGKEGASIDEIKAAAIEADADKFITELPQGYDTPVGEVGALLSGGQRQRISIARALIRRSPILVFDEATSALDRESEKEIIATIDRLRSNHTILMVTHNLQAIDPDIVFRIEAGQVFIDSVCP